MDKDIEYALNEWRSLNNPFSYAYIKMQSIPYREITVTRGDIHSNGFKECPIVTYSYYIREDGSVGKTTLVHN